MVWAPRETWSAQAASSPPPQQPKEEREASEKDNSNNIPATTLCEVWVERLFLLSLPA